MNISYIKKILLFLLGALILFASCKEDEIDVFSGESNVFFSLTRWKVSQGTSFGATYSLEYPLAGRVYTEEWTGIRTSRDSINCSYALDFTWQDLDTVFIPVSVIGAVTDYDRTVKYEITGEGDAVEGRDFKVLEAMVPANKPVGAIVVEIDRNSIKDTVYSACFTLLPNNEFQTNYKSIQRSDIDTAKVDVRKFKLKMSDLLEQPSRWYPNLNNYFGAYSRKKLYLVAEITGGDLNKLYTFEVKDEPTVFGWAKVLKFYLAEQKAAGNTIYDEDGTEMSAGPDA